MPLYKDDLYETDMYKPIVRCFLRYYTRGKPLITPYVYRDYAATNDIPDVVFIQSRNHIHVVEAKIYGGDIYKAREQLSRYRGNYKYIALPDGEYDNDRHYVDDLIKETRYGLILVKSSGNGLSADFTYDALCTSEGIFIKYY